MTIMMYIFDAKMSEIKYLTSNKKYVLKEDSYQRDKEYLMTLFFKYINENRVQIKTDTINVFFAKSIISIVHNNWAKVTHPGSENGFIFITINGTQGYRYDYFNLEDTSEKFKLIFIKTEYHKD